MQRNDDLLTPTATKILTLHPNTDALDINRQVYLTAAERGRHYLKVVLPGIPITVFTASFLFSYFMEVSDASRSNRPIDPTGPLMLSIGLTLIVCMTCAAIYSGFRQVTGLDE